MCVYRKLNCYFYNANVCMIEQLQDENDKRKSTKITFFIEEVASFSFVRIVYCDLSIFDVAGDFGRSHHNYFIVNIFPNHMFILHATYSVIGVFMALLSGVVGVFMLTFSFNV